MTKWQESCITALASSPIAWEAFKMKQKNKKLLWQYINRIWPYKKIEKVNRLNIKDTSITIDKINSLIIELSKDQETTLEGYSIDLDIDLTDIMPIIYSITVPQRTRIEGYNNLCNIYFKKESSRHGFQMPLTNSKSLLSNIHDCDLNFIYSLSSIYKIKFCNNIRGYSEMLQYLIQDLTMIVEALERCNNHSQKLIKSTYNWLNIGIEIEHWSKTDTPDIIGKRALRQNCVEYSFGYDGDSRCRLRENRLRLNGIKGLRGLYTLLSYMKDNCSIDINSSLHIHVDCKYDSSYRNLYYTLFQSLKLSSIESKSLYSRVTRILNIIFNTVASGIDCYNNQIRRSSEFNTLEFRFGIPNFNYSDYVIQILAVIHWTECLKHNTIVNVKYLHMLSRIVTKLRQDTKQLPMIIPKQEEPVPRAVESTENLFPIAELEELRMAVIRSNNTASTLYRGYSISSSIS